MINNQLTLLRDIKTVDQLIIKLVQLGYQRANDFEQEDNEWGEINKYCISRPQEVEIPIVELFTLNPEPKIPDGGITINPKSWLNNELANCGENDPFVDFSTHVLFDKDDNLYDWTFCYVEMGETWDIDINSVYIEKLDENLAEFVKVADKKLEERQVEILRKRVSEGFRRLEDEREGNNGK